MSKFYGAVGFVTEEEDPPGQGIYVARPTENVYYGDIIRSTAIPEPGEDLNDDLVIKNRISIVSDAYAQNNFHTIRYVRWGGVTWSVTQVEDKRPRLVLTLGSVYNGPTTVSP